MTEAAPRRRQYCNHLGQVITDPEAIEARYIQEQLRHLTTRALNAGKQSVPLVTLGELADRTGKSCNEVLAVIRSFDTWLWGVTENGPDLRAWAVFEEGE